MQTQLLGARPASPLFPRSTPQGVAPSFPPSLPALPSAGAMEILGADGLRLDGRRPGELRALRAELGTLPSADGSATFAMGNTAVIAAVYGPREAAARSMSDSTKAQINVEYAAAPYSGEERRARRAAGDRRAAETTAYLRGALEATVLSSLMPSSAIDVSLHVLASDGGARCAALNAAVLALADAGVPLRDLAAAAAVARPPGAEGQALLDPSGPELRAGGSEVSLALLPGADEVAALHAEGGVAPEALEADVDLAAAGCRAAAGVMRDALIAKAKRDAAARGD